MNNRTFRMEKGEITGEVLTDSLALNSFTSNYSGCPNYELKQVSWIGSGQTAALGLAG